MSPQIAPEGPTRCVHCWHAHEGYVCPVCDCNAWESAMSPSQKDDDGQEWAAWDMKVGIEPNVRTYPRIVAGKRIVAMFSGDEDGIRNRDRSLADHRDAQQLREQLEEAQDELKFVNLRKEEKLRDNLMHALGHTKDDGHTYEQHELGQFLEDVFYHYRDELPVLREQRDHSAVRGGVWAARAGLYASQRDKALERVRVLEEWIVEHEMHEEGCPQADEYKGEWDTAPDGALRKWLDEHQNCTCGMWELLGRVSLDDDVNRALLSPAAATEGGEGA